MPFIRIVIPGQPVAQGRPRAYRMGAGVRMVDPAKSRSWKGSAAVVMQAAVARKPAWKKSVGDQLAVNIMAYWPSIKPDRKRKPRGACLRAKRPDADNVAKAVMDAGEGVLWDDDGQIVNLSVEKWHAAQGDMARVEVDVWTV